MNKIVVLFCIVALSCKLTNTDRFVIQKDIQNISDILSKILR